jgi:hypothetical protein
VDRSAIKIDRVASRIVNENKRRQNVEDTQALVTRR